MTGRAALLSLLVMLGAPACEEYGPRIYTAHPYREGATCLEPSVPLGVVKAAELRADCDPICLLVDEDLYVSTVCPPLPGRAIEAHPDAGSWCAHASALLESDTICGSPPTVRDASIPDASALDAAPDALPAAP